MIACCRALPDDTVMHIVKDLCSLILKTTDKNTCTRALWCLSKQNLPQKIVRDEVEVITNIDLFIQISWHISLIRNFSTLPLLFN